MGPLAFGFGVGFGVAAWRVAPQLDNPYATGLAIMVALALYAAYLGGKRAGMGRYGQADAVAVADADATAASTSQSVVNLHLSGLGAREAAANDPALQLADAEWYGERQHQLDADGVDLDDIMQDVPGEDDDDPQPADRPTVEVER